MELRLGLGWIRLKVKAKLRVRVRLKVNCKYTYYSQTGMQRVVCVCGVCGESMRVCASVFCFECGIVYVYKYGCVCCVWLDM